MLGRLQAVGDLMEENGIVPIDSQNAEETRPTKPHLDKALHLVTLEEFEEELELYRTYGGD